MTDVLDIKNLTLGKGGHEGPTAGFCVMEAVAFINREPWSDELKCCSPAISAFCRSWNDTLDDADRNRLLKPLIPELVGTATSKADEDVRGWMVVDWFIREFTPTWLRKAGLNDAADSIAAAAEINSMARIEGVTRIVIKAQDDSSAARSAARSAAESAARSAARSAAESAARSAAESALRPTVEELQQSALELVHRMCGVGRNPN